MVRTTKNYLHNNHRKPSISAIRLCHPCNAKYLDEKTNVFGKVNSLKLHKGMPTERPITRHTETATGLIKLIRVHTSCWLQWLKCCAMIKDDKHIYAVLVVGFFLWPQDIRNVMPCHCIAKPWQIALQLLQFWDKIFQLFFVDLSSFYLDLWRKANKSSPQWFVSINQQLRLLENILLSTNRYI